MNSGEHKKGIRGVAAPLLIVAVIGLGWGIIQSLLYAKLCTPWLQPDSSNVGIIARIAIVLVSETLLFSAIFYCLGTLAKKAFSIVLFSLCLLTTANLAYTDYFGGIIHLRKIADAYTLTYVWDHLVEQIFSVPFYTQLVASICLPAVLWILSRSPAFRFKGSAKKKLLLVLPLLVLHFALYQAQAYRTNMSVLKARFLTGNATSYFLFGMTPVYSSMLIDLYQISESQEVVPPLGKTLNGDGERLPRPVIDPDAVFIIQTESLDASSIKLTSPDGQLLMPFLNNLSGESVFLENYFLHHNGAASASSEIAALLSIVPSKEFNGLLTIDQANTHSLNHALETIGFESMFLHSNQGSFFGRKNAYQNMAFQHFFDMQHFKGAAAGFKAKDKDFFEQSFELINKHTPADKKPFAYLVTMQSHGPFKNYDASTAGQLEAEGFMRNAYEPVLFDYLCSMRELDNALSFFWNTINAGPYKRPLVLLFPDHLSGILDKPQNGIEVGWAIIWSEGITPVTIHAPSSSYDIAPTVMHLLNDREPWDESRWWIGDTVFTTGPRKAIQVNNIILEGNGGVPKARPANETEQEFILFSLKVQK